MSKDELFNSVCSQIKYDIPPFLKAIVEECCENVTDAKPPIDENNQVTSAIIALGVSLSMLSATVKAGLQLADTVTVNYRGLSEVFDRNHYLLVQGSDLDFLQQYSQGS